MENNKKILIPTIVAVVTLVVLVVGATYAYFTVGAENNFETKTIEAKAESVGVVTLQGGSNLYLNIPAHLMMKDAIPEGELSVEYSAVTDPDALPQEGPSWTSFADISVSEGEFLCSIDYELNISGTMIEASKNLDSDLVPWLRIWSEQDAAEFDTLVIVIGGKSGDTCVSNGKCFGSFSLMVDSYGIWPTGIFMHMGFVNHADKDQTALAGTSVTVEVDVTDFSCTAVEPSEWDE